MTPALFSNIALLSRLVYEGGPQAETARQVLEAFDPFLEEAERRAERKRQQAYGWYENDVRHGGLISFVRYFWRELEPETDFVDGWVLWAMCEHLEAVTAGKITRLLINVPPGSMKSLLVDVFWPAWEWGARGLSHLRYVCFSYSASLTERDNTRFRHLVTCEKYQALYPRVKVDNKQIVTITNTKKGFKLATSVGGVGTGQRGDRVILDDPHNVVEAESEQIRGETVRWFRESMSSRLNDLKTGAIIIIMQRVHEDDVSGTILEEANGFDYDHLMVPMEYDASRQLIGTDPVRTSIGWYDWRYDPDDPEGVDGDLAWPERFDERSVERTRREIGPYAWASQYQQSPAPRGGGLFQREWWQVWDPPTPPGYLQAYPRMEYIIASLDSAYTEKEENDPSAMTVWGVWMKNGIRQIMLMDAWRKHLQFSAPKIERLPDEPLSFYKKRTQNKWGLVEWVADTCRHWKVDLLLIEPKASGISAAQELRNRFAHESWGIRLEKIKGDKFARALAAQPTFSQGIVWAPDKGWADMVISEMANFPKGKYDDLTDSATQAINYLRSVGLAQTLEDARAGQFDQVMHKSKKRPLYNV